MTTIEDVKNAIRNIPDFPKPGILFKDITPIIHDGALFSFVIDSLYEKYKEQDFTKIAAIESRGFIFGAALAHRLNIGFIPVRKKGKLPYKTISVSYDLEYGTDCLEMHEDALIKEDKVLIIDDLLATGGTADAAAQLIEKFNVSSIEFDFIIELSFLNGRAKISDYPINTMITF
ncbi:adenine phosphoribosyltransferase [Bacteroidales bacterium]|nr:adenine phosphoribosyltransferase [Bacteroidales bacterium]